MEILLFLLIAVCLGLIAALWFAHKQIRFLRRELQNRPLQPSVFPAPAPIEQPATEEEPAKEAETPVAESPAPAEPHTLTKEEEIWLQKCRGIIEDHLQNENFTVETMADLLSMSHSALYKRLRALTGKAPIKFITEYRIEKAVALFKDGYTNVNMTSEAVGFRDPKTFRDMFRRAMGVPPKTYIQSLRNKRLEGE